MIRGRSYKQLLWWLCGLTCLSVSAEARPFRLTFLNPAEPKEQWWQDATEIMRAACKQLDCELTVYWAERDRNVMVQQLKKDLAKENKPDVVVFQSLKENGTQLLDLCAAAKINAFIFNSGLVGSQKEMYGSPRQKNPYWLGQMLPNDEKGGYDLARALFKIGRKRSPGRRLKVVALDGTPVDASAMERIKGLKRAVAGTKDVELVQVIPAYWNRAKAKSVLPQVLKRYPDIDILWVANDEMALGALAAQKELQPPLAKPPLIGSFDWLPEALQAIASGDIQASVGGHFWEAAWVVVLLHDYFAGKDFLSEGVTLLSPMALIQKQNLAEYQRSVAAAGLWHKVDFLSFAKAQHPEIKSYDFTLEGMAKRWQR